MKKRGPPSKISEQNRKLIGTMPDSDVAFKCQVCPQTIAKHRRKLGKPPVRAAELRAKKVEARIQKLLDKGYTQVQIARVMGVSKQAIHVRVKRMRERTLKELDRDLFEELAMITR